MLMDRSRQYAWGKIGMASKVAELVAAQGGEIDDAEPYAELWMGTHVACPSQLTTGGSLEELIAAAPDVHLGPEVAAEFDGKLPFLFKVLSVNKALSIQAHPDKALAAKLHARAPDIYRDPNHKPEMAIALTDVEVLCGFRVHAEIRQFMTSVAALRALVGDDALVSRYADGDDDALKPLFSAAMKAEPVRVADTVASLMGSLDELEASGALDPSLRALLDRVAGQYPGDIGLFCVLFLNYIQLAPGQAVFLGPNQPHAYLSGDIVECMAASDNVVRAGCTPKLRDVDTLTEMLTYAVGTPTDQLNPPLDAAPGVAMYATPVPEFDVARFELTAAAPTGAIPPVDGPSIMLVVDGEAKDSTCTAFTPGAVFFISAGASLTLTLDDGSPGLVAYRAYCTLDK